MGGVPWDVMSGGPWGSHDARMGVGMDGCGAAYLLKGIGFPFGLVQSRHHPAHNLSRLPQRLVCGSVARHARAATHRHSRGDAATLTRRCVASRYALTSGGRGFCYAVRGALEQH